MTSRRADCLGSRFVSVVCQKELFVRIKFDWDFFRDKIALSILGLSNTKIDIIVFVSLAQ